MSRRTVTRSCRARLTGVLTATVMSVLAGCSTLRSDEGEDRLRADAEVVSVDAPAAAVVGTPLELTIVGKGAGTVLVDVTDPFATSTFAVELLDGDAVFSVPTALTSMSGVLGFSVRGASSEADTSTMLSPESRTEDIALHVGPRTIVAGGNDVTMAVAIAVDRFGNPVPDGVQLDFTTIDNDGSSGDTSTTSTSTVTHGVVWDALRSDDVAGPVDVFAGDSGATSGRDRFVEVPGAAIAPDVTTSNGDVEPLVADGRSVFTIRTTTITDRFGNVIPDGHLARLAVDGPDGSGRLTAKTIDGVARFDVVSPARPGPITFTASIDGDVGRPLELIAEAGVSTLPVEVASSDGRLGISIGPVLDERGAVVEDGTVARVRLGAAVAEVTLKGGTATIEVDVTEVVDAVEVDVLGIVERLELS